jgi:DNA polymerase-3 subunit epsilon
LTFVENNQIVATKSWLIKPKNNQFDYFNILVHGIRPEHVADKPEFNELWSEIKPLIENKFIIAHNASFDFSVLRMTLETYNLPFPSLNYSCSYIFSKKVWEGLPSYVLKTLCKINGISINHHRAAADSRATAEISLKAFKKAQITCVEDFSEKLKTTVGKIFEGGYTPCVTKRSYKANDLSLIVDNPTKHKPESIFYGKTVVFTGALSSMVRAQAQQTIADIGGMIGGNVTKDTDYLIVGYQDYRIVGDDGMSNKQEKAIKLIEKGAFLEILSEDDFIRNV